MKMNFSLLVDLVIILFLVFATVGFSVWAYNNNTWSETSEIQLDELEPGVYCRYNRCVSAIPAYNFDMLTIVINGQVYSVNGTVRTHYSENEHRILWERRKIINSDGLDLYVPKGSVIVDPPVTVK